MRILSIQSAVAYGHVGNSAAVFPLQRLGHEVWPVYTVTFSNHTGYGQWTGKAMTAAEVRDIIDGVEARGALAEVDLVLSGYLGNPDIADVIVETVRRVKALNPAAKYACDPVMGNANSGCFVDPKIPEIIKHNAAPISDIISPNQFELGFLTGTDPKTLDEVIHSIRELQSMGPKLVLVTSVEIDSAEAGTIAMIAAVGNDVWITHTPRLPIVANGSGDVVMSLFVGYLANLGAVDKALAAAASGVYAVLNTTVLAGERELQIVAAQEAFAHPKLEFSVAKIR